jgi:hypothetical protein
MKELILLRCLLFVNKAHSYERRFRSVVLSSAKRRQLAQVLPVTPLARAPADLELFLDKRRPPRPNSPSGPGTNCSTDLSMTGGPLTSNDENRPPAAQHRAANDRERSIGNSFVSPIRSIALFSEQPRATASGHAGIGSTVDLLCVTPSTSSTRTRLRPRAFYSAEERIRSTVRVSDSGVYGFCR